MSPVKTRSRSDNKRTTQASSSSSSSCEQITPCFFCAEVNNIKELRKASTQGLDQKVKECAQVLGDKRLLVKLSAGGDMIAMEAVYHRACLLGSTEKPKLLEVTQQKIRQHRSSEHMS